MDVKFTWLRGICVVLAGILIGLCLSGCDGSSPSGYSAPEYGATAVGTTNGIADSSVKADSDSVEMELANETDPDAKIVWSGDARIETKDYDQTVADVTKLCSDYGAQVLSSYSSNGDDMWYSNVSHKREERSISWGLRVPSDKFNDFFGSLNGVTGMLMDANKSRSDMTKSYNDNARKIELLESEYEYLQGVMEQTTSVTEMLEVRDRITDVLYDLQSLNDKNNRIDYDVEWSSIDLTVDEVVVYVEDGATYLERLGAAFVSSWADFKGVLETITLKIVYLLPYLFICVVIVLLIHRHHKKKKARKPVGSVSKPIAKVNDEIQAEGVVMENKNMEVDDDGE